MQKLKQLYRSNYAGENIVTQLNLTGGEWMPETEFVPNAVTNTHSTTQAVAIGNGESRKDFNLNFIKYHQGGILGANKLQSYGCNALYRDFAPDFLMVSREIAGEVAATNYCDNHIVYAHADVLLEYPGKFYLIPQNIQFDMGAVAAYMACFDGHKKVFLVGYDQYHWDGPVNNIYTGTPGYPVEDESNNGEFFARSLADVIATYPSVDFIRVMPQETHFMHPKLTPLVNLRQMSYREFVCEADLGTISV